MNFDDALKAHALWKLKLTNYIAKPDRSLIALDVGVDNKCPLGQWIYGEGAEYRRLPEFGPLVAEHARFHKAAASIIRKADSGQPVSADVDLGGSSEYAQASAAVIRAILKMSVRSKRAA